MTAEPGSAAVERVQLDNVMFMPVIVLILAVAALADTTIVAARERNVLRKLDASLLALALEVCAFAGVLVE